MMIRITFFFTLCGLFATSCCAQPNEPSSYPQKLTNEPSSEMVESPQIDGITDGTIIVLDNENMVGTTPIVNDEDFGMIWIQARGSSKKYHVYNSADKGVVYSQAKVKQNCFIVISKKEFRLYVYEKVNNDTLLLAHFPVCLARNVDRADKYRSGDGTTPHCAKDRNGNYIAFTVSQIQPSSSWRHDFKDGRGNILAYGDWFMRLKLIGHRCASNNSIGIHGSSGNELSVPGLDSEGCIRLRNGDLIQLHDLYANVGMKVIIKPKDAGKLPFEIKAEKQQPNYQPARRGYPLPPNVDIVKP